MPEIETINENVKAFKGLHLYHADMSNCSQRVRLALEEKGVPWTSHLLDLVREEHATPEYQSINPNGVVPTLIHDGRTIIESVDIIDYIDTHFDGPALRPADDAGVAAMDKLLDLAAKAQGPIKILTHEFLLGPARRMSPKKLVWFEKHHQNEALVAFMKEFSAGFSDARLEEAVRAFAEAFDVLEASLADNGGPWLLGDTFSLADSAWIVNVHRLALMGWDYTRWPQLVAWKQRMQARPSYQAGLADYDAKVVIAYFFVYGSLRRLTGRGINRYLKTVQGQAA